MLLVILFSHKRLSQWHAKKRWQRTMRKLDKAERRLP